MVDHLDWQVSQAGVIGAHDEVGFLTEQQGDLFVVYSRSVEFPSMVELRSSKPITNALKKFG